MTLKLTWSFDRAPFCSWNTTCIFLRVPRSAAQSCLQKCSTNPILGMLAFGWLMLSPHVIFAQELYIQHEVDTDFLGAHSLQSYDLDNDGDLDIIGAGLTVDAVYWWENDSGNGETWAQHTISDAFNGARFVDAADIDGDNDLDLFGAAASDDLITWWENTAGDASQWTAHNVDTDFDFAIHLHAADLDKDGDLDLMGAALKGDAIHWWENATGDGSEWIEHVIMDEFDGARHVCSVDMDNDGDLDMLGSAYIADEVTWWENTGVDSTNWRAHVVDEDLDGVNVVTPVDIDNDGDMDLLGSADIADDIVIWLNLEGNGMSWFRLAVDENFDGAFSTYPVDMDGDGDLDVLGAAAEGNAMVWWENTNGQGNSWLDHPIDEEFEYPMVISAGDFDKDGDMDILGGSFHGEVVWWENETLQLPVELVSFDAVVNKGEVELRWETASEINNAGFEVQHRPSRAAGNAPAVWKKVSFVNGGGTRTEASQYKYKFTELLPGNHRFRLKQIDFDGGFEYSPEVEVVVATEGRQTMSSIYPNPFNPSAQFYLTLSTSQEVDIQVYNALGQKVKQLFRGSLPADEVHAFNFEASNLPGGLYLINATGQDFSTTQRAMLMK